jgi:hypothetical protein
VQEVADLWADAQRVTKDSEAVALLERRGIDPELVGYHDLARVIRIDTHPTRVPAWARYRGKAAVSRAWTTTGHRLIVRAYSADGEARSVRAWRLTDDPETPKRVPPSGYRASGLVLANRLGALWLRGERRPSTIVVCEGEPDAVARSIATPRLAVIGILSGSWGPDFAARVPYGSLVILRSHLDKAGERYAEAICQSIGGRAVVKRWTEGEAA